MNTLEIDYKNDSLYFLESIVTICPYCESSLFISYHSGAKTVRTLEGEIKAKRVVKECTNKMCISKLENKEKYFLC